MLVRPEGGDAAEHEAEGKWHRLGFGETMQDRIEDGHVLVHPAPMMVVPPALVAPGTGILAIPSPTLAPAGGTPKPAGATTHDDEGPACPPQADDIKRGRNPSGDEFDYHMSLRINPESPTPKQSMATPGVTSQAYFLPSTTPAGQISFDDCKQRDTPTALLIPGLTPGAMFENKAAGWAWLLANDFTSGYDSFRNQVENQNAAVSAEERGRQIYYCFQSQAAASIAGLLYGRRYRNSHFLVCH